LHWTDDSFFPIDTVFYVIPRVELTYCFCVLQHLGLERMNTDAAVPGLNRNNVYRLLVAVPPSEIRSEFDQRASAIRRHQHGRSLESLSLQEGREALLPKLISGEVRITGGDIA
jgi:type I restriction enzyme S subunit